MTDTSDGSFDDAASAVDRAGEQAPKMLEMILAAARPDAVFGQPVDAGGYTLITASEVTSGGGFGVGMGHGPAPNAKQAPPVETAQPARRSIKGGGLGGGGGSMGRPVAIIAVGPNGVKVRPIVDLTKVGLAALTASAAMLGMRRAIRKVRKRRAV